MSKEKELQDELETYWGQLDRVERMLKWVVMFVCNVTQGDLREGMKIAGDLPDISDILEGK